MVMPGESDILERQTPSDISIADYSIIDVKQKILARQHYANDRQDKTLAFFSAKKYSDCRHRFMLAQAAAERRKQTLAMKLEAENKKVAQWFHNAVFCYALYGLLDGLSTSYSIIKYSFDIVFANSKLSSSLLMHDWLLSPEGIATSATTTSIVIASSIIANVFTEDHKNAFIRAVATGQPYGRDVVKGLKNAQKGVRSSIQTLNMLTGTNLNCVVLPSALILGALSVGNRIWYRSMKETRKLKQKINAELLDEIKRVGALNDADCDLLLSGYKYCLKLDDTIIERNTLYFEMQDNALKYTVISPLDKVETAIIDADTLKGLGCKLTAPLTIEQLKPYFAEIIQITSAPARSHTYCTIGIQKQTQLVRGFAFASAAYGGFIDGLYNNMGTTGVATLIAPPLFIALLVCTVLLFVLSMVNRIYEEYDFQRKLLSSQAKIELELCGKRMEYHFNKLQEISEALSDPNIYRWPNAEGAVNIEEVDITPEERNELDSVPFDHRALTLRQIRLAKTLEREIEECNQKRKELDSYVTLSYVSAALAGLRNGLYAGSAIGSVMYAVAGVSAIFFIPVSPMFLLACMIASVVCLIAFVCDSLVKAYWHQRYQKPQQAEKNDKLDGFLKAVKGAFQNKNESEVSKKLLQPSNVKRMIEDGMSVDGTPQSFFQEWFEVLRSFFSGIRLAGKLEGTFDDVDDANDPHLMLIKSSITLAGAAIYAGGLGLRAYVKGFGQPAFDAVVKNPLLGEPSPTEDEEDDIDPSDMASDLSDSDSDGDDYPLNASDPDTNERLKHLRPRSDSNASIASFESDHSMPSDELSQSDILILSANRTVDLMSSSLPNTPTIQKLRFFPFFANRSISEGDINHLRGITLG